LELSVYFHDPGEPVFFSILFRFLSSQPGRGVHSVDSPWEKSSLGDFLDEILQSLTERMKIGRDDYKSGRSKVNEIFAGWM